MLASTAERQVAYRQCQDAARTAIEAKNMPATSAIPTMPSLARWRALRDQVQALLQTMQEEMESYRDERSEQWQEGDRGEAFQGIIDQVDTARAAIEEISLE
jgi:division protein CdvB (Snf7/Vps24/ESCRT-III family)